jgi:hypothetical protein
MSKVPFPPGTRVRPTYYAITQFPKLKGARGVVTGFRKDGPGRSIRWDYRKTSSTYHPIFFDYARAATTERDG